MTKKYELAYIFSIEGETSAESMCDTVRSELQELEIQFEDENNMGVCNFAYPIRKQTSGHYYFFTVRMAPEVAFSLDGRYRHNPAVLRQLVIRLED